MPDPYSVPFGQPVEIQLTSALSGAVEFVYTVGFAEEQVLAAGLDGRATLSFTPPERGDYYLMVFTRSTDGQVVTGSRPAYLHIV